GGVHARDRADPLEHQIELGEVAAADVDHQVPGAGGRVELLDLRIAAQLVDDVVIAAGVRGHQHHSAHGVLLHVAADPDRESLDHAVAHQAIDPGGHGRAIDA